MCKSLSALRSGLVGAPGHHLSRRKDADLSDAELSGANLSTADLGPMKRRGTLAPSATPKPPPNAPSQPFVGAEGLEPPDIFPCMGGRAFLRVRIDTWVSVSKADEVEVRERFPRLHTGWVGEDGLWEYSDSHSG